MIVFEPLQPPSRQVDGLATEAEVATEPMLYSASTEFARTHGGPLTMRALEAVEGLVPSRLRRWTVIDTRCHMLMPGMFPAIPGWHCDAVPRNEAGQPDLRQMGSSPNSHAVVTFGTAALRGAQTEFTAEHFQVDPTSIDPGHVWRSVSRSVDDVAPRTAKLRHGQVAVFGENVLHRATPATQRGWRFFFRVSAMRSPPRNEIRRQVQVYADVAAGW